MFIVCQNTFINFHDLFLPTSLSERLLGTLDYTGTKKFSLFYYDSIVLMVIRTD